MKIFLRHSHKKRFKVVFCAAAKKNCFTSKASKNIKIAQHCYVKCLSVEKYHKKGLKSTFCVVGKVWKKDFHLKNNFSYFSFMLKLKWSARQDEEKTSIGHLWLLGLLLKNMLTCLSHYSRKRTEENRRGRGTKDIFKQ